MEKYYCSGAVVISIAGREKNQTFLILKTEGNVAYLINGKARPIESPKKKNFKHLQLLSKSSNLDFEKLTNADVIKFLKDYNKSKDCK
jgi:ribosomal protein L14E/L6E/L27E